MIEQVKKLVKTSTTSTPKSEDATMTEPRGNSMKRYKFGDEENHIWAGDLVSRCEFIQYLPFGIMVFREISPSPCVRAVFYESVDKDGGWVLNGWNAYNTIKELKADLRKQLAGS